MSNKSLPLISIVTPSLNQGDFIEATLLSVKIQEYPNIEHIVVDGGSTDDTKEILKKYDGTYNMRWISESDDGMYEAINKGLQISDGEILAYLSTDDLVLPWSVETVVDHFRSDSTIDLFYGDLLISEVSQRVHLGIAPPFRLNLMLRTGWSLPQPTVFWTRRLYERIGGFDESLKYVGDWDFWIRAVLNGAHVRQIREFLALTQDHSQAKHTKSNEALEQELRKTKLRYVDQTQLTRSKVFRERLYAKSWQRFLMANFLLSYLKARLGRRNIAWSHFLRIEGLTLGSWPEFMIRFLPFGHRGRHKWTIQGSLELRDEGLKFRRQKFKKPGCKSNQ